MKKLMLNTLLLLSWILSSGQKQVSINDTIACYNKSELIIIANKLIRANECEQIHILDSLQIKNLISNIDIYQKKELEYTKIISNYKNIESILETKIEELNKQNKKLNKLNNIYKIGLISFIVTSITIIFTR